GVRGKQRWELQGIAGKTQLFMRDSYQMPSAFGRFFDKIFTRFAVAQRDRAWLARLQHLAERRYNSSHKWSFRGSELQLLHTALGEERASAPEDPGGVLQRHI